MGLVERQYTAPQSALRLAHHSDLGGWWHEKRARLQFCGCALLVDGLARCYLVAFSAFMVMVWKRCSIQASGECSSQNCSTAVSAGMPTWRENQRS